MRALNFLMAVVFVLAGLPGLFFSLYLALVPSEQHKALNGSYETEITDAKEYVQRFREQHARMPTAQDFDDWARVRPDLQGIGFSYKTAPFSDELISEFGKPPVDAYVFEFFRGGSPVYYPSWSSKVNSVYIADETWWSYGSRWADLAHASVWWLLPFFLAGLCMMGYRDETEAVLKKST